MVRRLLPLILVLAAGCAFSPPFSAPAVPVEVKVPVYRPVYCQAPPRVVPELPIAALSPTTDPADTMRAYVATVIVLKGMVRERDALIAGCAEPPSAPAGAAQGGNRKDSVRVIDTSTAHK
jgi:hypothetical protein